MKRLLLGLAALVHQYDRNGRVLCTVVYTTHYVNKLKGLL